MTLVVLGCIGLAGCGSDDVSSSGGKSQNETKAEKPNATPTNKPDDNNTSVSENAKIPDKFPKEIPIIKGAYTLVAMSSDKAITVSYEVNKTFDEVLKVYKDYFKSAGYTNMQETVVDDSYIGIGERDGNQLNVMLGVSPDDPDAIGVTLTYGSR